MTSTLGVSAAVAVSGSAGFVGLVVPHLARRLVGATHRLAEPVRVVGLDVVLSEALDRWRAPAAVHDPAKVLLDLASTLVLGGDCLNRAHQHATTLPRNTGGCVEPHESFWSSWLTTRSGDLGAG